MKRHVALLAVYVAFFSAGVGAQTAPTGSAQAYPVKPIRVIVPYAAGGNTDFTARAIADRLTPVFKQQVIVDNRPGGATNIGSDAVAKATPDGYTLLMGGASNAINMSLFAKLPYDTLRDFEPITLCVQGANVLAVHPSLPVKNLKELIALAKAQPGKLTYASFGAGSAAHLAGEMFLGMTGTNMIHVPYKGSAPAVIDVMGGRVTMMLPGIGSAINLAKDGKLRALAVSTAKRVSGAPDIPTIAESGVPGFDVGTWESIQAPAGTPAAAIARLNTAIREVVATPELRQKMINLGFEPDATKSPAEAAQFVRSERSKFGSVVKERKITVE